MKRIFLLILIIMVCSFLGACAGETTVEMSDVEKSESSVVLAAENGNAQVTEKPGVGEDASADEEVVVTTDQEQSGVQNEVLEEELEYEISDEEWQSVHEGFQNWLSAQKNPPKYDSNEIYVEDENYYPIPVEVKRSDEEARAFLNNFLDNYHNSASFRNLEGEGLTYLDQCLDVMRNDPYSEPDIVSYIEKYKSGTYDDEMFTFMLECWIEFGGSFGEGCTIYIQ